MTAVEKIRARIAELTGIRERYLAYQQDRVNERDHHGAWDVAVNLSETECEISGLEFALKAIDVESAIPAVTSRYPWEEPEPLKEYGVADHFSVKRKGVDGAPHDFIIAESAGGSLIIGVPTLATYLRRLDQNIGFGWVLSKRKR